MTVVFLFYRLISVEEIRMNLVNQRFKFTSERIQKTGPFFLPLKKIANANTTPKSFNVGKHGFLKNP